jgi:hypothetical protein
MTYYKAMVTPWSSPSHWSHWGNGRPMVAARDTGCCSLPEAMYTSSGKIFTYHQFPDISCIYLVWCAHVISQNMQLVCIKQGYALIIQSLQIVFRSKTPWGKRVSNDMAATGSYLADLVKHRDITHGWWCSNMFQWNAHETTIHQSKRGSSFSSFWMIYDPCAWRWWPLGALTTTYDILLHMIYIYIHTHVTSYVYVFSPPKMVVNPAFWWDIVGYSL